MTHVLAVGATGADAGTSPARQSSFGTRGITVLRDILMNAGGVVMSYFEWVQNLQQASWSEDAVNKELGRYMARAYQDVSDTAAREELPLGQAAYQLADERVLQAETLWGTWEAGTADIGLAVPTSLREGGLGDSGVPGQRIVLLFLLGFGLQLALAR